MVGGFVGAEGEGGGGDVGVVVGEAGAEGLRLLHGGEGFGGGDVGEFLFGEVLAEAFEVVGDEEVDGFGVGDYVYLDGHSGGSEVVGECTEFNGERGEGEPERGKFFGGEAHGLSVDGIVVEALGEPRARAAEKLSRDVGAVDVVEHLGAGKLADVKRLVFHTINFDVAKLINIRLFTKFFRKFF